MAKAMTSNTRKIKFRISSDIKSRAKRSSEKIKVTPIEFIQLMDEADEALNAGFGIAGDPEHEALFSIREKLSEMFEDPKRRSR